MLRKALFNIIRLEQGQVEERIAEEQKRSAPDVSRLNALHREQTDLRQELEQCADR